MEARGELVYSFGVTTRKISLATMCKVLSENSCQALWYVPPEGHHRPGADADIVVYDPQADHITPRRGYGQPRRLHPYEGFVTHGSVSQVWLRGNLMVENGHVTASKWAATWSAAGKNML